MQPEDLSDVESAVGIWRRIARPDNGIYALLWRMRTTHC